MAATLFVSGCKSSQRASLEKRYSEARLQFLQGYADQPLQTAETGFNDSVDFPDLRWKFRILWADAKTRKGHPADAINLLAQEPSPGLSNEIAFGWALTRGYASCINHDYSGADVDFVYAEQLAGPEKTLQADLLVTRGRCELAKGVFDKASSFFTAALESAEADQFAKMYAWMGAGRSALRRYRYEDAIQWYLLALNIETSLQALPAQEATYGNLGYLYQELGDFEKAREYSQRAEDLAEKLGFLEDQGKWALDVGRDYHLTGRLALAQQNYTKALGLAQRAKDYTTEATSLHNLVQIELRRGNLAGAERYHEQAKQFNLHEDPDHPYFKIDTAFIAAAKRDWSAAEHELLDLISGPYLAPFLRGYLEAVLGRLYADEGKPEPADHWFRQGVSTMQAAAAGMKRTQFKIAMMDNWPIFDDYIAFLYSQGQTERALQVAQMARARTLSEELGLKHQDQDARPWVRKIQTMLRARGSLILAFYEAERETYAWVVTGNKLEMRSLGAGQNELETLADEYRTEIDQQTSIDASPAQQKLYQILIKPVSKLIPHGSHIILVADSALYRINFEALISDEGTPHYWIDDVEVENASSIDLLLAEHRIIRKGKGALIIGAPVQVSSHYPLLPHAHEEVESVQAQFRSGDVKALKGRAATPLAYRGNDPSRYKYIEFASHSEASSSDPLQSAIILSNDEDGSFRLFARDIVEIKPRLNAELVTISGCFSSGKLNTSAEGLLGLQWAFMRAGAHQVVAGLWDVDDKTSPELMGALYAGIVHGESPARALRAAKLRIIHSAQFPPAPYYWASLQLYTGS